MEFSIESAEFIRYGLVAIASLLILLVGQFLWDATRSPYTIVEHPHEGLEYKLIVAVYSALKSSRPIKMHAPLSHIVRVDDEATKGVRRHAEKRIEGITVPVIVGHPKTLAAQMVLLEKHWKQCRGVKRKHYKIIDKVCTRAGIPVVYPLSPVDRIPAATEVILEAFKELTIPTNDRAIPVLNRRAEGLAATPIMSAHRRRAAAA